jgi:hypothetical protein
MDSEFVQALRLKIEDDILGINVKTALYKHRAAAAKGSPPDIPRRAASPLSP